MIDIIRYAALTRITEFAYHLCSYSKHGVYLAYHRQGMIKNAIIIYLIIAFLCITLNVQ